MPTSRFHGGSAATSPPPIISSPALVLIEAGEEAQQRATCRTRTARAARRTRRARSTSEMSRSTICVVASTPSTLRCCMRPARHAITRVVGMACRPGSSVGWRARVEHAVRQVGAERDDDDGDHAERRGRTARRDALVVEVDAVGERRLRLAVASRIVADSSTAAVMKLVTKPARMPPIISGITMRRAVRRLVGAEALRRFLERRRAPAAARPRTSAARTAGGVRRRRA